MDPPNLISLYKGQLIINLNYTWNVSLAVLNNIFLVWYLNMLIVLDIMGGNLGGPLLEFSLLHIIIFFSKVSRKVPKTMTNIKWYCWMDSVLYYIILTITINSYPYSKFLLDFPALMSESVLSPSYGLSLGHFHISRSSVNMEYFPFCSRHFQGLFFYFWNTF